MKAKLHRIGDTTKSIREWSRDPRCCVARSVLTRNLLRGMPIEEALQHVDPYGGAAQHPGAVGRRR